MTKTETYLDPKTGKEKRRSAVSKNERFRMLLRISVQNEIQFGYVLTDLWYASAENMEFVVRTLQKHFVFPLRRTAKLP
ncbi:MAG: hypothetical protein KIT57_16880 [Blastocatellales bacterium]|nr:hypothetical protein [Blastocatellales bacterium]